MKNNQQKITDLFETTAFQKMPIKSCDYQDTIEA